MSSGAGGTAQAEGTRVKVRTKHDPARPYLRAGFGWNGQWSTQTVTDEQLAELRLDPHLRVELAVAGDSFPVAGGLSDVNAQNESLREENARLISTCDQLRAERDKLQELLEATTLPPADGPQRAERAKSRAEKTS